MREYELPLRNDSHTGLLAEVRMALFEPGFVPVAEVLLFRQKDPKPVTPRPAASDGTDAS